MLISLCRLHSFFFIPFPLFCHIFLHCWTPLYMFCSRRYTNARWLIYGQKYRKKNLHKTVHSRQQVHLDPQYVHRRSKHRRCPVVDSYAALVPSSSSDRARSPTGKEHRSRSGPDTLTSRSTRCWRTEQTVKKKATRGTRMHLRLVFGRDSYTLLISRTRTSCGEIAFRAAEPRVWNYLPNADGPQTAGFVIQPFQTVAGDVFIWLVGTKRSVNLLFKCSLEILLLTCYLLICADMYTNHSIMGWALVLLKASACGGWVIGQLITANNGNYNCTKIYASHKFVHV